MARFQVNDRVRVMDKGSPYHGRCGVVKFVTSDNHGFHYGVEFEWAENTKLSPINRFVEEQLEPVV